MPDNTTIEQFSALYNVLAEIDSADREYVARFIAKNFDLGYEALVEKFTQDQADRQEAAALQEHRLQVLLEELGDHKNNPAVAKVLGVSLDATPADTNAGDQ